MVMADRSAFLVQDLNVLLFPEKSKTERIRVAITTTSGVIFTEKSRFAVISVRRSVCKATPPLLDKQMVVHIERAEHYSLTCSNAVTMLSRVSHNARNRTSTRIIWDEQL